MINPTFDKKENSKWEYRIYTQYLDDEELFYGCDCWQVWIGLFCSVCCSVETTIDDFLANLGEKLCNCSNVFVG